MARGPKNAYIAIYDVRISDPADYQSKAKAFLDQQSGPVGHALANLVLPEISKLPRQEFRLASK